MEPVGPEAPERLEAGPSSPVTAGRRFLIGVAAAFAAGLAAAQLLSPGAEPAAQQPAPPSPRSTVSPSKRPTPPAPSPPARIEVSSSRGFLADLDIAVVARRHDGLVRIETRAGRMTRTPVASLQSSGPVLLLAGPDRTIVRPWDGLGGSVVRHGRLPEPLTGLLGHGSEVVPGPRGRIWLLDYVDRRGSRARLTDLAGHRVYTTIQLGGGAIRADGAGGLLYTDVGGWYRVIGPSTMRRVTRGAILAVGPRDFLILDCDARRVCSTYLKDRQTGRQRRIGGDRTDHWASGVVSRDGRFAAVLLPDAAERSRLQVIDLGDGRVLTDLTSPRGFYLDEGSINWLPDGRLLTLQNGEMVLIDPARRTVQRPDLGLSALLQLTVYVPDGR